MNQPSAWLRGPVEGVPLELQASAHALIDAGEQLIKAAGDLTIEELWVRPGGAASIGFHLRHIAASSTRLTMYSRGQQLDDAAQRVMALEKEPGTPPADAETLLAEVLATIERTLAEYRSIDRRKLNDARTVGRANLPSTVLGALAHVADHMQRHSGQVVTTAKIVRGLGVSVVAEPNR